MTVRFLNGTNSNGQTAGSFVDLTSAQTVGGAKTFTSKLTAGSDVQLTGGSLYVTGSVKATSDVTGSALLGSYFTFSAATPYTVIGQSVGGVPNGGAILANNATPNGNYAAAGPAGSVALQFVSGQGSFYTAAPGNGGNGITWAEKIRLTNDGYLKVLAGNLEVTGSVNATVNVVAPYFKTTAAAGTAGFYFTSTANFGEILGSTSNTIHRAGVADGATAVSHKFSSLNTLSTAGAKIASFYNDAELTEKAYVDKDGNFFASGSANIFGPTFSQIGIGTTAALNNIAAGVKYDAGSTTVGFYNANNASALGLNLSTGGASCTGLFTAGSGLTSTVGALHLANGSAFITGSAYISGSSFLGAPNVAPAGSSIANGQFSFWLDEVGNNLMFAVKTSTGAAKTGSIALT